MKTPKNILIQQLKQQQRLGAKKNKTLADKTLSDNMAKAGRAAAGATDVFQEFVDNVTAASTQQAKLGSGLQEVYLMNFLKQQKKQLKI